MIPETRKSTLTRKTMFGMKNQCVFNDFTNTKVDVDEENAFRHAKTNGFLTMSQMRNSTLTKKGMFNMKKPIITQVPGPAQIGDNTPKL